MSIPPPPSRRRFLTNALGATFGASLGVAVLSSCQDTGVTSTSPSTQPGPTPMGETPVSTGDQALQRLLEGNARFVANRTEPIDEGVERRVAVSKGQQPFATVIGCVDSRVPIELVFDRGLGDLVVVRSAGQALDHSVTESLEFGVAELHTPLLMVLGHQRCGAIDATVKALDSRRTGAHEGELEYLVDTLSPAVRQVAGKPGDKVDNAVRANVHHVLAELRTSKVLAPLEKSGKLKLVGAYYALDTGKVTVM